MNWSKKSNILVSLLVLAITVAFFGYQYVMKPPASIESKTVHFTGNATDFITKVQENPTEWLDKVVVLKGTITIKDEGGITLNNQVYCQFKENLMVDTNQQKIKIKGRFIGYDDLMDELKLDQCILQD